MLSRRIYRRTRQQSLSVTTLLATTEKITIFGDFAGGVIHLPSDTGITELTWYGSADGTNYAEVTTADAKPTGAGLYRIPDELFGCAAIAAVASGGSADDVSVCLKS